MSEILILNLCHKKSILVDIYRQSLLIVLIVFYNHKSSFSLGVFTVEPICMQLWAS